MKEVKPTQISSEKQSAIKKIYKESLQFGLDRTISDTIGTMANILGYEMCARCTYDHLGNPMWDVRMYPLTDGESIYCFTHDV